MGNKAFDVTALGELLIDFTENGSSAQGNPMLEANPGGAPCNAVSYTHLDVYKRQTAPRVPITALTRQLNTPRIRLFTSASSIALSWKSS